MNEVANCTCLRPTVVTSLNQHCGLVQDQVVLEELPVFKQPPSFIAATPTLNNLITSHHLEYGCDFSEKEPQKLSGRSTIFSQNRIYSHALAIEWDVADDEKQPLFFSSENINARKYPLRLICEKKSLRHVIEMHFRFIGKQTSFPSFAVFFLGTYVGSASHSCPLIIGFNGYNPKLLCGGW